MHSADQRAGYVSGEHAAREEEADTDLKADEETRREYAGDASLQCVF